MPNSVKNNPIFIPTPQDVLEKIKQQRTMQWSSGNVAAMHQATVGNALDALFGNPQVKKAEELQGRVKSAMANVVIQEGDDDVTSELRRLSAMRDAVSDLDPAIGSQITTKMLELTEIKLQREKLTAQTESAKARTINTEQDTVLDAMKAIREESKLPLEQRNAELLAQTRQAELAAKASDRTNWMNPVTGQMQSVLNQDTTTAARLAAEGWVEAGNPQIQGTKDEVSGLSRPTVTDLEGNIAGSRKQLDTLYSIAGQWKPEYLTLPKQWAMGASKGWERLTGGKVNAKVVADAEQYYAFRRNTLGGLNEYIKYITGAQAAVAEYERIQKAFPNMDMAPTEFVSSLREVTRQALAIEKRAQQALAAGLKPSPEQIQNCNQAGKACIWENMALPPVSDDEVDRFLAPLGIPAKGVERPNGASGDGGNGWRTMPNGARVRVKPSG